MRARAQRLLERRKRGVLYESSPQRARSSARASISVRVCVRTRVPVVGRAEQRKKAR